MKQVLPVLAFVRWWWCYCCGWVYQYRLGPSFIWQHRREDLRAELWFIPHFDKKQTTICPRNPKVRVLYMQGLWFVRSRRQIRPIVWMIVYGVVGKGSEVSKQVNAVVTFLNWDKVILVDGPEPTIMHQWVNAFVLWLFVALLSVGAIAVRWKHA